MYSKIEKVPWRIQGEKSSKNMDKEMTFWSLTSNMYIHLDLPTDQTFHQFHDLDNGFDLYQLTSGDHGVFASVAACQ